MNSMFKRLFALALAVVMVMSYGVMPVAATEGEGTVTCSVADSCEAENHDVACPKHPDYVAPCTHEGTETTETVVAATCVTAGSKTVVCACGVTISTETIAATGEHVYGEDNKCTCGAEKPAEHTHSFSDGTVTTEATCAAAGVLTKTCDCGATETEVIAATGAHTYENGVCVVCTAAEPVTCDKTAECGADTHADCLSQCTGAADCGNSVHTETCEKGIADKQAAEEKAAADAAKVAEVNTLIAALPDVVTTENYSDVMAQLEIIMGKQAELGELWAQVNQEKLNAVIMGTYSPVEPVEEVTDPVAKIGETGYETLQTAMTAANAMTGEVTVEIYGEAEFVDGMELNGSYSSINFVGKDTYAKITINQSAGGDYLEAHGKTVAFTDLILAKANPAWSGNSGHMGNYFSVQGGTATYTNCIFPNGACTSNGTATYNNCTFNNTSEYGLWVYSDAHVTVSGGKIDSIKGIKVYKEQGNDNPTLTVENATFTSTITKKPAVAIAYADSVTLIGNTYENTTATLELDSGIPNGACDADCNGVTIVAKDTEGNDISKTLSAIDRKGGQGTTNDTCGVLVDGKIYTTVATAVENVESGDEITILYDTTSDEAEYELPAGVTVSYGTNVPENENITVKPTVATINGTAYETLQAALNAATSGQTIELLQDVTLTSTITVPAGVTIDGGEDKHTLSTASTFNSDYAVKCESGATLKNLTIDNTKAEYTIDLRNGGTLDSITLNSSKNYGVMLAYGSATITNSSLNTAGSYNIFSDTDANANATVTIKNNTFTGTRSAMLYMAGEFSGNTDNTTKGLSVANSGLSVTGNTFTGKRAISVSTTGATISANNFGSSTVEMNPGSDADLSANYWYGGNGPAENQINTDPDNNNPNNPGTFVVTTYYKSVTTDGALTDLAAGKDAVAQVGNTYYSDLTEAIAAGGEVTLLQDVTIDVAAWNNNPIGNENAETITINGNGHTLTFNQTNSDWNNVVTANDAKLILNNMKITNSGHNDSAWNRHDINFACPVELNNVTSDKALAFKDDATLNNVTINDANTSDTYAIWIQPNGQNVSLNNCTIDMLACTDGRGIKIDDQYVDDPGHVTLSVSNTSFKTEEKAAILVKNGEAGATITLNNVDISGVAADTVNPVWVDEDDAANAENVTVNGLVPPVEGADAIDEPVAKIGYVGYESLAAAVEVAEDLDGDSTIVLLSNVPGRAVNGSTNNITITGLANGKGSVVLGEGDAIETKADGSVKIYALYDNSVKYGAVKVTHYQAGKYVPNTFIIADGGYLEMSSAGVVTGYGAEVTTLPYNMAPINNDATYVQSSSSKLKFESNMFYATFANAYVDGKLLSSNDYDAEKGSTIITLSNSYLRKLSTGKHTLTIEGLDGNTANCSFYVVKNVNADETNPKTGDTILLPAVMMMFSATALAVLLLGKKKRV